MSNSHAPQDRERIEELLLEGLDSGPATPMTKRDWDELRKLIVLARQRERDGKSP